MPYKVRYSIIDKNLAKMQESSLPNIFTENSWVSPNAITRSRVNANSSPGGVGPYITPPSSTLKLKNGPMLSPMNKKTGQNHPMLSLMTRNSAAEVQPSAQRDPFDMSLLISESESLEPDTTMEETVESSERSSTTDVSYCSSDSGGFLEPDEVSISAINECFVPFYRGSQRIQLLHKDVILQLGCMRLKVRFGFFFFPLRIREMLVGGMIGSLLLRIYLDKSRFK